MPTDDDTAPRLFTVGLNQNTNRTEWNLPEVEASVRAVASAVAPYSFRHEDWSTPGTTGSLRDRIVGLGDTGNGSAHPPTLLYWCGHGQLTDRDFFLITNDASSASALGGAFSARDLGRLLREEEKRRLASPAPGWRIVIIDTCDSGIGIAEMAEAFPNAAPQCTLLIASAAQGAAGAGDFGTYLASVFEKEFINQTDPIRVLELKRRVEDWLRDSNLIRGSVDWDATIPAPTAKGSAVTTSMDLLSELQALPEEAVAHFFSHAQVSDRPRIGGSVAEVTSLPWHFVGRIAERTRVAKWLTDGDDGMLAVVGVAGSGKSAMLGMVLAATIDDLLAELRRRKPETWPDDVVPHGVDFDVVCHLSGQSGPDFVASLHAALGQRPVEGIDAVVEQVRDHGATVTILADALDESLDPVAIASALRALAELPGVKVLVGTRRSVGEDPDDPSPTPLELLPLLGNPPVCEVGIDPEAAATYVGDRLTEELPDEHAQAWASEVGSRQRPFLFARLAVHEALANPSEDPRTLLDADHKGLFAQTYRRLAANNPRTGALLRVLALAHGRGLPRNDGIWALAASVLAGEPVRDPDIAMALDQAAPYIVVDHEFGQACFRLAHRTFVEFFSADPGIVANARAVTARLLAEFRERQHPVEYLRNYLPEHLSAGGAWGSITLEDLAHLEPGPLGATLTRDVFGSPEFSPLLQAALIAAKESADADGSDWSLMLDLACRRLGRDDPALCSFLRWSDLQGTSPHIPLIGHTAFVTGVAIQPGSEGLLWAATCSVDSTVKVWDPTTGAVSRELRHSNALRDVALAHIDDEVLVAAAGWDGIVPVWDAITGEELARLPHGDLVNAVGIGVLPDETVVVASVGEDCTVKLWDLATSTILFELPLDEAGTCLGLVGVEGSPLLLAVGSATGIVTVVDAVSGNVHRTLTCGQGVRALSTAVGADGRAVLVTDDGSGAVWDPLTGARGSGFDRHHTMWGVSVARAASGELVAVCGDAIQGVLVWGVDDGRPLQRLRGHSSAVSAVAMAAAGDGRMLLITASDDNTARLWDASTSSREGNNVPPVTQVAFDAQHHCLVSVNAHKVVETRDPATGRVLTRTPEDGAWQDTLTMLLTGGTQTLVVSRFMNGTSKLWDPATGRPLGDLVHHTSHVRTATTAELDGEPIVVTAGADTTACIWSHGALLHELAGHAGQVNAVAVSPGDTPMVATASSDRTVRLWDAATGEPAHSPMHHLAIATDLCFCHRPDGSLLVASTSVDETLRLWDPADGSAVETLSDDLLSVSGVEFTTVDDRCLVATLSDYRFVALWQIGNDRTRLVRRLDLAGYRVASIALWPDALALGTDRGLLVLDLATLLEGDP